MDLAEVSILDKRKKPAYDGTLIMARDDSEEYHFRGEDFIDEVTIREESPVETGNDEQKPDDIKENALDNEMKNNEVQNDEPKQQDVVENTDNREIDYSKYENMLKEMKEE